MKFLLAGCLFLMSNWLYADEVMTVTVNQGQEQFEVILPSNPTTGYQWKIKNFDNKLFKVLSNRYVAPKTKLMGAGGQMIFTFGLVKDAKLPQSSVLEFIYARPWEPEQGTLKNVTVNFQASDNNNQN